MMNRGIVVVRVDKTGVSISFFVYTRKGRLELNRGLSIKMLVLVVSENPLGLSLSSG